MVETKLEPNVISTTMQRPALAGKAGHGESAVGAPAASARLGEPPGGSKTAPRRSRQEAAPTAQRRLR
eukprot:926781-Pyramimonas_sp.AAC.1